MRRWNGWGDDGASYPVSPNLARFLASRVGPGRPCPDAAFSDMLAAVPLSRLPAHPGIVTEPADRLRHARGQSLPDWIALRSGRITGFPDGVAYPESDTQVRELLDFATRVGACIIPYGGGTSVVGGINVMAGESPVLTLDLRRLSDLLRLDDASGLATFGAGVPGPALEARLRARGYTLGHYPQSFEYSTLGGWIVTRSTGQQSMGYGRIERLFAGGKLQTPAGTVELPVYPASSAGPDLRELVLGSEGRLGVLTEATVRIAPLPELQAFHTVFFPDWDAAFAAARAIAQARVPLSLLRQSTAVETETTLTMAGHERAVAVLERLLAVRGARSGKCMLLLGVSGRRAVARTARSEALGLAARHGGVHVGQILGKEWRRSRFRTPYLRNSLWDMGYAIDTVETAVPWSAVPAALAAIEDAIRSALAELDERVHVFSHLSHLYVDGSSIYTTCLFRIAPDPDETLQRWERMKAAASQAIVAHGGTITHQHGIGVDHMPYLSAEKGRLAIEALHSMAHVLDPNGIMNPGKLLEDHR